MRLRVTILFTGQLASVCLLALAGAAADTIHLKNGRSIVADHVREKGNHYEYDIGDDSYAIPKSVVDHIDAGGMPAASGAAKVADLPVFTPADSLANEGDLVARIIKEGKVDLAAIASLESKGNAELSATADFIAGKFELEHGNIALSRQYFENALRFEPNNATVLVYYAALLVKTGNASQALSYAQDAVISWKRSLELRPDARVERLLAKAQREQSVESEFSQGESSHFVLHYEGKQTTEALRAQILAALEADYDDLVRDLGNPPRDNILVTLYTEQAFFDVTHAPGWSGAINDGKLRIPISGLSSVTPDLARVLKHELAHSFITHLSGGRCPVWLHEGIAQFLEPRSLGSDGRQLSMLFKSQRNIALNALEGNFLRFSGTEAYVAYAESLE